jgi:hypothetical protein
VSDLPRAAYQEKEALNRLRRDEARAASLRLSTLRVATFLGAAGALLVADVTSGVATTVAGTGVCGASSVGTRRSVPSPRRAC